jgi:TfuA protein
MLKPKPVVFLGPSLESSVAETILDATYLPPIQRGDIDRLLASAQPPHQIGIIDGRFLQQLSISPKEVLTAMDRGIRLFGGGSMGALRAVELHPYGMRGIGRIFELYRSGEVDGDDEVAITFHPDSLRCLCEPLVNVRLAVSDAVAVGVLEERAARTIITAGKSIYFPDRNYRNILDRACAASGSTPGRPLLETERSAFERFLRDRAPDAKREDALALLCAMAIEQRAGAHGSDVAAN